jgi:hypothetical protein
MSDGAMTEAELSTATGAAPGLVRRLVALGIVPGRDGERPFVPGDVHRVRLAQAFERSGIPLEAIGAAVASGHLSFGFVDQMFVGHAPTFSEWKAFFPPEALNEQLLTQAPGSSARPPAGWPTGAWPSTTRMSRRRCSPRG